MYARHRAFNLIELLVALSIVGLIAAILYPVFARVRAKAQRATCQNNLHQIGLAFHQYSADYDGRYPLADTEDFTGRAILHWQDQLFPYAPADGIYNCPSDTTLSRINKFRNVGTADRRTIVGAGNYALNGQVSGELESAVDENTILVHDANPSQVVTNSVAATASYDGQTGNYWLRSSGSRDGVWARHQGQAAVLWRDGRARCYPLGRLAEKRWWTRGSD